MTHAEIRAAIAANGWLAKSPGEIAELLNAPTAVIVERMIGVGTVLDALGPANGAALLDQMEAQTAENSTIKWGLVLLKNAQLDVGMKSTRDMLDALLPAEAATVLKGLAEQTVTAGVTWQQVRDAMEGI